MTLLEARIISNLRATNHVGDSTTNRAILSFVTYVNMPFGALCMQSVLGCSICQECNRLTN